MELKEAIYGRRSVRKYDGRPIAEEDIREIIEAGVMAPNASNFQPWYFVAVANPEKIQEVRDIMAETAEILSPSLTARFEKYPQVIAETKQFIRLMGNAPCCILAFLLKDDDEAQDAVSDMFARLAEGAVELPAEHPERYLTVTVRNLCFDRIRQMTMRERIERRVSLLESEPASWEAEQERIREMNSYAEKAFTKQTWKVFQLRFDEGLLYREIAERLGISEITVYKHLAEALRELRKKFNPS